MQNGSIAPDDNDYWRRNLVVCVFGSFTTIVAMTLLLPFLPLYVEQLGVTGHAAISEWSGVAYGAAFFTAALTAPLWGRLGDRYGRKLMLIRASLGMAVAMTLLGMAQSVWQLVALRLLAGLLGGYASGSTILVATQTPKARTGWALGMLSSGIMAGNLVGPLIGGTLPPLIGIRATFMLAGGAIFIAFLATVVLLKEVPGSASRPAAAATSPAISPWRNLPVMAMLITGTCSDAINSGLICNQFWTPINPKKWLFWTVQNCLQTGNQAKLRMTNSRLL
ncbi:MFS transporter [Sodalis endosymbiont of Spalangia cameroni]